jgi:ELWxxDGT repeat protein
MRAFRTYFGSDKRSLFGARRSTQNGRDRFFCEPLEARMLLAGLPTLIDIFAGAGGSSPENFINVNNTLFFTANNGSIGHELWKSDGTTAGTVLVKDIGAGATPSNISNLTNVNGTLFFSAYTEATGYELWKSNGTTAGTVMVKDIRAGGSSHPSYFTNVNGTLFFAASDGFIPDGLGDELWKSDGTAAGTVRVKDIVPGNYGSYPQYLINVVFPCHRQQFEPRIVEERRDGCGHRPGQRYLAGRIEFLSNTVHQCRRIPVL